MFYGGIKMNLEDFGMPFFRTQEIKGQEQIFFLTAPIEETNKWGKKRLSARISHQDITKKISLAGAHVQQIVRILGSNGNDWIGKPLNVRAKDIELKDGSEVKAFEFFSISEKIKG